MHFSIFLTLGSLLVVTNAFLAENQKTMDDIFAILGNAFEEASFNLLADSVINEANFKEFLGGKTAEGFKCNEIVYGKLKNQLYFYYVGYTFLGTYPSLKNSMNSFVDSWLIQHPKHDQTKYIYTQEYENFLKKEQQKNKELVDLILKLREYPDEFEFDIEEVLSTKVELAYTRLTSKPDDQTYYDKIFTAFENKKFDNSITKFTKWRTEVLGELNDLKEMVERLFVSFESLDPPDAPSEM